ncbi:MAG: rod shape-determining protein MreC [Acidobacteriota bacterium]|nr:rod shape-determining protein MreC [Acidobacteriota bacterium]
MTTGKRPGHHVVLALIGLLSGQMLLMSFYARQPETGQSFFRVWMMTVVAPYLKTVGAAFGDAVHVWQNYADLRRSKQEVEQLRRHLAQTQLELHQLKEATRAATRLDTLARYQQTQMGSSVIARVIQRDVSGWFGTILIDRGRRDGVAHNSVVMTPEGLVGRVIALGPSVAQVQLITDERSGAGAVIGVIGQSRALGVVEGRNEALCKMRYVPGREIVPLGEIVYTSGQDGIYPPGIPIGRIIAVQKGSVMVSHDITIEPLAPLAKLEEVIVLLSRPSKIELDSSVAADN